MSEEQESGRKPWHQHFETIGSISAIIVGVAALYVSWDQGRVMRDEVRASVWPVVQMSGYINRRNDQLVIGLSLQSAGVGPARVERITIRQSGDLVTDLADLLERMPPGADRSVETSTGRIMAPGGTLTPFELRYSEGSELTEVDAVELYDVMSQERVVVQIAITD
ncbi:MAG: hypothetical protein AAGJ52_12175 [Pseudomonadota bacterium]